MFQLIFWHHIDCAATAISNRHCCKDWCISALISIHEGKEALIGEVRSSISCRSMMLQLIFQVSFFRISFRLVWKRIPWLLVPCLHKLKILLVWTYLDRLVKLCHYNVVSFPFRCLGNIDWLFGYGTRRRWDQRSLYQEMPFGPLPKIQLRWHPDELHLLHLLFLRRILRQTMEATSVPLLHLCILHLTALQ